MNKFDRTLLVTILLVALAIWFNVSQAQDMPQETNVQIAYAVSGAYLEDTEGNRYSYATPAAAYAAVSKWADDRNIPQDEIESENGKAILLIFGEKAYIVRFVTEKNFKKTKINIEVVK